MSRTVVTPFATIFDADNPAGSDHDRQFRHGRASERVDYRDARNREPA
jgi:hypothetical protein